VGRIRRVLLRRAAAPRRPFGAAAGALDRRPHPALRGRGARRQGPRRPARFLAPAALGLRAPPRTGAARLALARRERGGAASLIAAARPPHEVPVAAHARRDRVPVGLRCALAVEIPRPPPLRVRRRRPAL